MKSKSTALFIVIALIIVAILVALSRIEKRLAMIETKVVNKEVHYLLPADAAVRLSIGEMWFRDSDNNRYKVDRMIMENQIGPLNFKANWNPWDSECWGR